jgi:putative ABC transport system substrate-binding protein
MTAADKWSRMPRIVAFAVIMILAALAPVLSARAAEPAKMFHVGIVFVAPCVGSNSLAFEQELRELGYVEGKTLAIDLLCLEQIERYPTAMEELVGCKVDVIVTTGQETALKAAKQATATIPIVMLAIDFDPVAKGYAASLARPGGNITGVFLNQTELTGKRLELLKQTVPDTARAIVFWDANSADQFEGAATSAQLLKLPLKSVELRNPPYDYVGALEVANSRPGDALLFLTSPFFYLDRNRLAELALQHRLPSIFANPQYTDAGGLVSYGPSYTAMFRLAAEYVDKIPKGAARADLPIQQPTNFELIVNLKTAKALGLTVPPAILARTDGRRIGCVSSYGRNPEILGVDASGWSHACSAA